MSGDRVNPDRLQSLGRLLDERVDAVTAREALNRAAVSPELPGPPRRRVPVIVAAALVVVALLATALAVIGDDRASVNTARPVTGLEPGQCEAIDPAPVEGRQAATGVWTGKEMILWGGQSSGRALGDGAAYDPATGAWRTIAQAPIAPRYAHVAVWTGKEMIVWGGRDSERGLGDGAAYDPVADSWRTIPVAPSEGTTNAAYAWTGEELIIAGGSVANGSTLTATQDAAAYDPATDQWRILPPSPVAKSPSSRGVWTGSSFVVTGDSMPVGPPGSNAPEPVRIAAFDPDEDVWAPITGVDLAPVAIGGGYRSLSSRLSWDGREVLVINDSGSDSYAVDPNTLATRAIRRAPTDASITGVPVWTGSEVVFWSYGSVSSYNPGTDEWREDPLTPSVPGLEESVVWTGQELLAWGGSSIQGAGAPLGIATGVAYRPDGDATSCPLRAGQIAPASDGGNPLPSRPALSQEPGQDWQTIENEAAAVSMQIPPDWRSLSLVVGGDDPPEVLAAGNAARPSGLAFSRCPLEPVRAGSTFVAVAEVSGEQSTGDLAKVPVADRPADFASGAGGEVGCSRSVSPTESVEVARIHYVYFRDHGRTFVASVVTGAEPSLVQLDEANAVLNSLRVRSKDQVPNVALSTADEAEIRLAFDAWLSGQPRSNAGAFIDDYDAIAESIRASEAGAPPDRIDYTGTVDGIEGIDRNTARVTYSIIDDVTILGGRQGTAVKVNGKWLVSRDTVCALIALGGVATCPARQ